MESHSPLFLTAYKVYAATRLAPRPVKSVTFASVKQVLTDHSPGNCDYVHNRTEFQPEKPIIAGISK